MLDSAMTVVEVVRSPVGVGVSIALSATGLRIGVSVLKALIPLLPDLLPSKKAAPVIMQPCDKHEGMCTLLARIDERIGAVHDSQKLLDVKIEKYADEQFQRLRSAEKSIAVLEDARDRDE